MTLMTAMPVAAAARLIKEHDTRMWRVLHHWVEAARARADYADVSRVAIDETAAKRGHDYVSLFVDIDQRRVLFVTDGRGAGTVRQFADDLEAHNGDASHIKQVCIDMSAAFIKGVTTTSPRPRSPSTSSTPSSSSTTPSTRCGAPRARAGRSSDAVAISGSACRCPPISTRCRARRRCSRGRAVWDPVASLAAFLTYVSAVDAFSVTSATRVGLIALTGVAAAVLITEVRGRSRWSCLPLVRRSARAGAPDVRLGDRARRR